ncbi:MAG: hypothetical protein A3E64_00910 [Candidatus Harrisonbacteria bacterium RIFCSPHIGHO2_12_FULL_48_16]|uniref:50S ribosomal protein L28 n=1 Tax=Candidatus Harrisonbacteria bacterium RIFCSPHIGHO2_12_FULL_48_16 TaxID=1798405 RepID=A0A1G1ZHR3_9BACT|nr:MAG: hypothetical protein A3E64_00910 [Candidatus Harrisonbacteria bacterium RIFCSPHIGHO2_12_FULL_48_16]
MRQCAICGKGSIMAGTRKLLRGHYNPTNWSRKYPNLQKAKLPSGKSGLVCTQCIKTMAKPVWAKAAPVGKAMPAVVASAK